METTIANSNAGFNQVETVYEFNRIATGIEPGKFDATRVGFYIGHTLEEVSEILAEVSMGVIDVNEIEELRELAKNVDRFANLFKSNKFRGAIMRSNRGEVLDGFIDVIWTALGGAMNMTPRFREALVEVGRANMSKFPNGQVIRDSETGKVLKPAGWTPPNVEQFLEPLADD